MATSANARSFEGTAGPGPPYRLSPQSGQTDSSSPAPAASRPQRAVVTGTLETNGRAGTVSHRWRRSDGTVSGEFTQPVAKGSHRTDVVLRWTFDGKGTMAATAVLDVTSPTAHSASTSFTYTCR
ncbi:hypothetical protein [Kitasatospora sp. MAP5-34]|uniref:hypothetical protein n=1 Tax=Kitasatospora sp. MAP5-34 TaxID=3035102 RepID=UPI00247707D0|nr:hypothetical protein [Kitasatospora sp. MAP5-34]